PGEDLADEPVLRADRHLGDGAAVLQRPGAALDLVAGDRLREPHARQARVGEPVRLEVRARLERVVRQRRALHPVEPERPLALLRAIPGVDVPVRELALELVRLDDALGGFLLALLLVLDLDEAPLVDPARQRGDQALLGAARVWLRRLRELELAECLLEL